MNYFNKKLWWEAVKIGFKLFLLLMSAFPLYGLFYTLNINEPDVTPTIKILSQFGVIIVFFLYPYLIIKAVKKLNPSESKLVKKISSI